MVLPILKSKKFQCCKSSGGGIRQNMLGKILVRWRIHANACNFNVTITEPHFVSGEIGIEQLNYRCTFHRQFLFDKTLNDEVDQLDNLEQISTIAC